MKKKKKIILFVFLGIFLLVLAAAAAIYVKGALYYEERFFEGTTINGISCTNLTTDEVKELLQEQTEQYQLTLKFRGGTSGQITGTDLGIKYEDDGSVDRLLQEQEHWKWVFFYQSGGTYEVSEDFTYPESTIDLLLWDMQEFRDENQIAPEDAYLKDCGTYYEIVPEVMGSTIRTDKVKELVKEAIASGRDVIDLEAEECYEVPSVYQDDETLCSDMTQLNHFLGAKITYDFEDREEVIDAVTIKEWLYKDDEGTWQLDTSKAEEFVQNLKSKYDTFGRTRSFVTSLGTTVTLSGGDYGWAIKKQATVDALVEAICDAKVVTMEPVYTYKGWSRATNDIGGTYVEVSVDEQRMWCYKDGKLVVDTPVVTGDMSKSGRATPTGGVWAIDAKVKDKILRGPGYASHVTFWLPFNGGVGIHDATWRSNFGGTIYLTNGSHGCINTPYENAEKVFNAVDVGCPVIVY